MPFLSSVFDEGLVSALSSASAKVGLQGCLFPHGDADGQCLHLDHAVLAKAAPTSHHDFLFGGGGHSSHDAWTPTISLLPKLSMLGGVPAAGTSLVAGVVAAGDSLFRAVKGKIYLLDPFDDGEPEESTGWTKFVPRGLRFFTMYDVASGLLVLHSLGQDCNVPLRAWLLGGIVLGLPVSGIVKHMAKPQATFGMYRLTVSRLRGDGPPDGARVGGLQLYARFQSPISQSRTRAHADGQCCIVILDKPEFVTAYRLITHDDAAPELDPISWVLEGSTDGVEWTLLHTADGADVSLARGAFTQRFEDLLHLTSATASFRSAFLVEALSNIAAFGWLVAGTAWISQGEESCVDSAPALWYSCFTIVVMAWSFLGIVAVGLVVSAVAMVWLGQK